MPKTRPSLRRGSEKTDYLGTFYLRKRLVQPSEFWVPKPLIALLFPYLDGKADVFGSGGKTCLTAYEMQPTYPAGMAVLPYWPLDRTAGQDSRCALPRRRHRCPNSASVELADAHQYIEATEFKAVVETFQRRMALGQQLIVALHRADDHIQS